MVHVVSETERREPLGRGVVERPWRDDGAMTIADHGEPSVALRLVTTAEGDVAAGDTGVGCGPHCRGRDESSPCPAPPRASTALTAAPSADPWPGSYNCPWPHRRR